MGDWKRLNRKGVYDTPFLKLWEDTIELPSGRVVDDYSVAELPDGVLVVATDTDNNVLLFDEYKYAVDDTVLTFPAGGIDEGETPEQAAARELLEETGYESTELEVIFKGYPYPSKLKHVNYIVRARNAKKITSGTLSDTETVGKLQVISIEQLRDLRKTGKINTNYMIAALALVFPETL